MILGFSTSTRSVVHSHTRRVLQHGEHVVPTQGIPVHSLLIDHDGIRRVSWRGNRQRFRDVGDTRHNHVVAGTDRRISRRRRRRRGCRGTWWCERRQHVSKWPSQNHTPTFARNPERRYSSSSRRGRLPSTEKIVRQSSLSSSRGAVHASSDTTSESESESSHGES